MKIGELAKSTGTPVETIRFYEREGLLPEPARTATNYRVYGAEHVDRLAFIRHCRALDMALDEVRALLKFKDAPDAHCGGVSELLDAHISHVSERIHALRQLKTQLISLRQQCPSAHTAADCKILHELSEPLPIAPAAPATRAHRHIRGAH